MPRPPLSASELSDDSIIVTENESPQDEVDSLAAALQNVNLLWKLPPIPPPKEARHSHYKTVSFYTHSFLLLQIVV